MRANPFSGRTLWWLLGVGGVSLLVATYFAVFGAPPPAPPSIEANTFSRSAIGHEALIKLLRELKIPVVVSYYESGRRSGEAAALVVAEPDSMDGRELEAMVSEASHVLLVLPKWTSADPSEDRPRWAERVAPLSDAEVQHTLSLFVAGDVERWINEKPAYPLTFEGDFGPAPELPYPQLIRSEELAPIIASNDGGVLLGETYVGDTRLWVLADPDVFANHGLARGDNAILAVTILEQFRGGERTLIFDETAHGFVIEPNIWRELLQFPLVLVSIQVALVGLILLWASLYRFGAPLNTGTGLAPGASFLINNTASLLLYGGHAAHSLDRYLTAAERAVGKKLHAPTTRDRADLLGWLERMEQTRKLTKPLRTIRQEVAAITGTRSPSPRRLVRVAQSIHRWKKEMLHGRSNG